MKPEVKTKHNQAWSFETDLLDGVCVIANDKMQIQFIFKTYGKEFLDVLKVKAAILEYLKSPTSVEGAADWAKTTFPSMSVIVRGRAESHGWIESVAK